MPAEPGLGWNWRTLFEWHRGTPSATQRLTIYLTFRTSSKGWGWWEFGCLRREDLAPARLAMAEYTSLIRAMVLIEESSFRHLQSTVPLRCWGYSSEYITNNREETHTGLHISCCCKCFYRDVWFWGERDVRSQTWLCCTSVPHRTCNFLATTCIERGMRYDVWYSYSLHSSGTRNRSI